MTVKIFNNDNNHWIYLWLTTGKGPVDIWHASVVVGPETALPNVSFSPTETTGSISIQRAPVFRPTQALS